MNTPENIDLWTQTRGRWWGTQKERPPVAETELQSRLKWPFSAAFVVVPKSSCSLFCGGRVRMWCVLIIRIQNYQTSQVQISRTLQERTRSRDQSARHLCGTAGVQAVQNAWWEMNERSFFFGHRVPMYRSTPSSSASWTPRVIRAYTWAYCSRGWFTEEMMFYLCRSRACVCFPSGN